MELNEETEAFGYLYMFLGIFLFATIEITAKIITSISKVQQNFFRMVLGVLIIGLILFLRKDNVLFLQYLKKYWKLIIGAGIIWISIASPTFFFALNLTRASTAALLLASNPIIVSLGSMMFLGEKSTKIKVLAVILGFIGVFILITEFKFGAFEMQEILGNILAFFAVFGYSIYTLVSIYITKKEIKLTSNEATLSLPSKVDLALIFNLWGFLFGILFLIPVFLFDLIIFNPISHVSGIDILLIFYLGIMTTGIAYILYTLGINKVEPSRGVLLFYSKPLISMFLAWLLLQESLTVYFILGFSLILLAVILSEWEKSKLKQNYKNIK
jgi:drug/metabolite transporter (DMT)-like permease